FGDLCANRVWIHVGWRSDVTQINSFVTYYHKRLNKLLAICVIADVQSTSNIQRVNAIFKFVLRVVTSQTADEFLYLVNVSQIVGAKVDKGALALLRKHFWIKCHIDEQIFGDSFQNKSCYI